MYLGMVKRIQFVEHVLLSAFFYEADQNFRSTSSNMFVTSRSVIFQTFTNADINIIFVILKF